MTDPRIGIHREAREALHRIGKPYPQAYVDALNNLLDGFGVPRSPENARTAPLAAPGSGVPPKPEIATGGQQAQRRLAEPDKFYSSIRRNIFGGMLKPTQFEGIEALLAAMAPWPISWVAYALATAKHETAATMQPIKEYGGEAYFRKMYDPEGSRPQVAARLGNTRPGDGARYAGRGYVQLTGRSNYAKASTATGVDLIANPDLAMKPDIAAKILLWGMEGGKFTGKKLGDYLQGSHASFEQYREARRIINALDKAAEIAKLAEKFQSALAKGGWG